MKAKTESTTKFTIDLDEREMGILGALVANLSNDEALEMMVENKKAEVEYDKQEVGNLLYALYTLANDNNLVL